MYIAIAGNIGSGKTSLTGILAERTGARAYYEATILISGISTRI